MQYVLSQPQTTKYSVYLLHTISHFTDHFSWWQAVQRLPILQSTMRQDLHVTYQCIMVNIRFLLTFKDSAKTGSLELTDKYHT